MTIWNNSQQVHDKRLEAIRPLCEGKVFSSHDCVPLLEKALFPRDRVCVVGDRYLPARFLLASLSACDPELVSDLHLIHPGITAFSHQELFEKGIASSLDFCIAGPLPSKHSKAAEQILREKGRVHTCNDLHARMLTDLVPDVALVAAEKADRSGNLYTGPNSNDTRVIIDTTAFRSGLVIAQVNEISDRLPRIDIPGDRVDVIVQSPYPSSMVPLFTFDPARLTEVHILLAMMVIKGIYAPYGVDALSHDICQTTTAIELLLPTYGDSLGLRGKALRYWANNPAPSLIPAIESGFVKCVFPFAAEVGMENYVKARPDIFFTGKDGSLRPEWMLSRLAAHYAVDAYVGTTLQMDIEGNCSIATPHAVNGFGGAPAMGCDDQGRRFASKAWQKAGMERAKASGAKVPRGRKLLVQAMETFHAPGHPSIVETLDALHMQDDASGAFPGIMVYGEDVSHVVTEEGIANLLLCRNPGEREQAIRGVAGYTPAGMARDKNIVDALRKRGVIQRPEDLGIMLRDVKRDLLAAKSLRDIVDISGDLYEAPSTLRTW